MGGSVELSQVNKCVASFIQLSFLLVTRNPYKWRQGSLHLETKCYSALEVSSFQKSVLSCLESVDRHDVLSVFHRAAVRRAQLCVCPASRSVQSAVIYPVMSIRTGRCPRALTFFKVP